MRTKPMRKKTVCLPEITHPMYKFWAHLCYILYTIIYITNNNIRKSNIFVITKIIVKVKQTLLHLNGRDLCLSR